MVINNITKQATQQNYKKDQLAGLIFLLIILVTLLWMIWIIISCIKDKRHLPSSKLVVTGERYFTTNDDIRQVFLSLGASTSFIKQDINIFQQHIEYFPWIKQGSVRKQWPNKLRIHLVEYVPVARWNDLYLLSSEGKPFIVPLERIRNQKLVLLYGSEGSEYDVLNGYQTINKILAANKFKIKKVTMSARHSWQLTLDNDVRLELGRDDLIGRLKRFIELYQLLKKEPDKQFNYIDLRYDSGAAVG
ncbi:cell division protein FtsQ/DivIB [Candidatus Fukatsuia anoeciicola]